MGSGRCGKSLPQRILAGPKAELMPYDGFSHGDSTAGDPRIMTRHPKSKRVGAIAHVGMSLGRGMIPAGRRRGFPEPSLLIYWEAVVGQLLAEQTSPERLARGTLRLRVSSDAWAVQVQHLAPSIADKINQFLGRRAVERITLTRGRITPRKASPPPPPLPAPLPPLPGIADPELNAALARLGGIVRRAAAIGGQAEEPC